MELFHSGEKSLHAFETADVPSGGRPGSVVSSADTRGRRLQGNDDLDHVLGLELGADDYVIKPVEPRVLAARIHALLRRSKTASAKDGGTMRFGRLLIDSMARSVHLDGRSIALSGNEFDLLAQLAARAGVVQSREALYQRLYNREYDGVDRMLDIRISHLRRKLGEDAEKSERIKTIWGHGYLFVPGAW